MRYHPIRGTMEATLQSVLLGLCLLCASAIPVRDVSQRSMLDLFGPPSLGDSTAHTAQSPPSSAPAQTQQETVQQSSVQPLSPPNTIPDPGRPSVSAGDGPGDHASACPPKSVCVYESRCASADEISYELGNNIYHQSSQYDRQNVFTQRYTCGQAGTGRVCCPETSLIKPEEQNSPLDRTNPFGFPDNLGTGAFHFHPAAANEGSAGDPPRAPAASTGFPTPPAVDLRPPPSGSHRPPPTLGNQPQQPSPTVDSRPTFTAADSLPSVQSLPPAPHVAPGTSQTSSQHTPQFSQHSSSFDQSIFTRPSNQQPQGFPQSFPQSFPAVVTSGGSGFNIHSPQGQGPAPPSQQQPSHQNQGSSVYFNGQPPVGSSGSFSGVLPVQPSPPQTPPQSTVSFVSANPPVVFPDGSDNQPDVQFPPHSSPGFPPQAPPGGVVSVPTQGPFPVPSPPLQPPAPPFLGHGVVQGTGSGFPPPSSGQPHSSAPTISGFGHNGFGHSSGFGQSGGFSPSNGFDHSGGFGHSNGFDHSGGFGHSSGFDQSGGFGHSSGFDQGSGFPQSSQESASAGSGFHGDGQTAPGAGHDNFQPHAPETGHHPVPDHGPGFPHGSGHGHFGHRGPPHSVKPFHHTRHHGGYGGHGGHHHGVHIGSHGHYPKPHGGFQLKKPPLFGGFQPHHRQPHGGFQLFHPQPVLSRPPPLPSLPPLPESRCGEVGHLGELYTSVFGEFTARISSGFGKEPGVADYASHPWHAAVLRQAPGGTGDRRLGGLEYICGATLVSDRMLVTAAHCVQGQNAHALVVRLGEYNLYSDQEELYPPVDAAVLAIHVHPEYLSSVFRSDLAVLQLQQPLPLHLLPHVTPACLDGPDLTDDFSIVCQVPGWGYDAYQTQPEGSPHALKAVAVQPVSVGQCTHDLRQTLLGKRFKLQDGSFCAAGQRGQDTCLGDGGGGLVCPVFKKPSADQPPKYQLVGVTSWGVHCGDGRPGVYTDVKKHIGWLKGIIQ